MKIEKKRFSLQLTPLNYEKVAEVAENEFMSANKAINHMIRNYKDENGNEI